MKKALFRGIALLICLNICSLMFAGCGGKKEKTVPIGLPDYSEYENDLELQIGGWNPPPPKHTTSIDSPDYDFQTAERYKEMAECGLNLGICVYEERRTYPEEFEKALNLAAENGIKLLVMDYKVRPENFDPDTSAEQLLEMTADYNDHPAFAGHHVIDEPATTVFDSIGKLKTVYDEAFPDKVFFVNLLPSYATTSQLGTAKGYDYYVQYFIDRVSPDVLSLDYYPFKGTPSSPILYSGLLGDYEIYAENAKLYGLPFWAFIGSMGWTGGASKQPNIYDLRFMINAALMFGANTINHFCYWQPYDSVVETENTYAMVKRDGTVTDVWYNAQTIHKELKKFDHVLLSYDWQGIMVNVGTENKRNTAFDILKNPVEKHDRVSEVVSNKDLAIGIFKDKNNYDGFYIMNYNDTKDTTATNTFSITFKDADQVLVYVNGEEKIESLTDGKLTMTLGAGDAVFAIPVLKGDK